MNQPIVSNPHRIEKIAADVYAALNKASLDPMECWVDPSAGHSSMKIGKGDDYLEVFHGSSAVEIYWYESNELFIKIRNNLLRIHGEAKLIIDKTVNCKFANFVENTTSVSKEFDNYCLPVLINITPTIGDEKIPIVICDFVQKFFAVTEI